MSVFIDQMEALAEQQTDRAVAAQLREAVIEYEAAKEATYPLTSTQDDIQNMATAWSRAYQLYRTVAGEPLV